jgi:ABC-type Fe3+ transport system permease subunit
MPAQQRIERLSSALWWVVSALVVVLPLVALVHFARAVQDPARLLSAFLELAPVTPGRTGTSVAAALGALTLVPVLGTLVQMRRLFSRYRAGEVLTDACAAHIRATGLWLGALAVLQVAVHPLQTVALSFQAPAGQRQLSVALTGETLWLLLAAGLLAVIGHAMRLAARTAEENRSFV